MRGEAEPGFQPLPEDAEWVAKVEYAYERDYRGTAHSHEPWPPLCRCLPPSTQGPIDGSSDRSHPTSPRRTGTSDALSRSRSGSAVVVAAVRKAWAS